MSRNLFWGAISLKIECFAFLKTVEKEFEVLEGSCSSKAPSKLLQALLEPQHLKGGAPKKVVKLTGS